MRYFAELQDNKVTQVIVSEEKPEGNYVETFLNKAGKNYAGIGFEYLPDRDNFVSIKPFESWTLNDNCLWQPPLEYPVDEKRYFWNEEKQIWQEII